METVIHALMALPIVLGALVAYGCLMAFQIRTVVTEADAAYYAQWGENDAWLRGVRLDTQKAEWQAERAEDAPEEDTRMVTAADLALAARLASQSPANVPPPRPYLSHVEPLWEAMEAAHGGGL